MFDRDDRVDHFNRRRKRVKSFLYFCGPLKFAKLLSKIANYFADLQLPRRDLLRHVRIVDVFVLLVDVGKCRKRVIGS